jgi:hypothetical protein
VGLLEGCDVGYSVGLSEGSSVGENVGNSLYKQHKIKINIFKMLVYRNITLD